MDPQQQKSFTRFSERYTTGQVPWDDRLPPPEVQALAATLPPGRALDLGCGYGRTAIYLAQQGWWVEGIDFVPQAIAEAKRRAAEQSVAEYIQFHLGSVAEMDFLDGRFDLAVDIGCLHSLSQPLQRAYRDELLRLLRPGALYLLFARLQDEAKKKPLGEDAPSGMKLSELKKLLAQFQLQKSELGVTEGSDYRWKSGWFWYEG